MTQLIAFCGLAGAGKSFAAAHLSYAHGFQRERFAEPLKAMLRAFGLDVEEVDGARKAEPSPNLAGATPRHAMQTLGEEWGRALIAEDIWVEHWARRADARLAKGERVVVDDLRYRNEAHAIWRRGGKLIRIEREGLAGKHERLASVHKSESLDRSLYDHIVINDGSAAFVDALDRAVKALG